MNLLRFQSVFALCVLFLLFGYDQVTSAPPSNMTEDDQNPCASPCYESLKEQIEIERKSRIEIEGKHKLEIENLKNEKDRIINELETTSKKDSADHKVKEENFINELKDLKSEVSSYKEKLKECQNQLSANNQLTESNFRIGCKGLSSGIHTINIPNLDPFLALCDFGWIVIQKRFDGSQDFYRNWTEYRKGFGKLDGEFFIGLEKLHRITNSQRYELYIEVGYLDGDDEFVRYDNFRIGNENEKYELKSIGDFIGSVGHYLDGDVGAKFSTYDQDNDGREDLKFAEIGHGGWWYNNYHFSNLNGRYYKNNSDNLDAMRWGGPIETVQMLIRPKSERKMSLKSTNSL